MSRKAQRIWKTLDEIRREGLEALRERLGRAGMIRFMQQFETGSGDYATARHEWVDKTSLDDLREMAQSDESAPAFNPKTGKFDLRDMAESDEPSTDTATDSRTVR